MADLDTLPVAIVGVGKIARDRHIPAIEASPRFSLAATASLEGAVDGVQAFSSLDALIAARPDVKAVALCTPPQARCALAARAIAAGLHVLLEKPPGQTVSEVEWLADEAKRAGVTLFATWHSRYNHGVAPARDLLARRRIRRVDVTWKEDVRHWHPGQAWIWKAGGAGVFDPGINALSVLTAILPRPVRVTSSDLEFPSNCETPIAARIAFTDALDTPITADFDWRETREQAWTIRVETDEGTVLLTRGGAELSVDGASVPLAPKAEYHAIYARFADLADRREVDVDVSPLRHVADAFMLGRRIETDPFHD